jgi:serine phosphatase RsbU (regulator of sigma subunit)
MRTPSRDCPGSQYKGGTTRLESGDWLVIFTDRIVEAENAKQDEYSEPELIRLVDRESRLAPAGMFVSYAGGPGSLVRNTLEDDDLTCLLLKRT